jgi:hypothetical protein
MLFASSQRSLKAYARGPSVLSGTYRNVAFVFSLEWELAVIYARLALIATTSFSGLRCSQLWTMQIDDKEIGSH